MRGVWSSVSSLLEFRRMLKQVLRIVNVVQDQQPLAMPAVLKPTAQKLVHVGCVLCSSGHLQIVQGFANALLETCGAAGVQP